MRNDFTLAYKENASVHVRALALAFTNTDKNWSRSITFNVET